MDSVLKSAAGALSLAVSSVVFSAAPSLAATYAVELTQTGLGDDGPDWFGTFTVADNTTKSPVSSISLTVAGTEYSLPGSGPWDLVFFPAGAIGPEPFLYDLALSAPVSNTPTTALWFWAYGVGLNQTVYSYAWTLAECTLTACWNTYAFGGTATVTEIAVPAVPVPAAGWLGAASLGALALGSTARRRKPRA